ncbi:MAG: hypothetical protein ACJ8C4_09030 [Gemmataceae bacterium]
MAAKKSPGRVSTLVAVIFTSLIAPLTVNIVAAMIRGDLPHSSPPSTALPPAILATPESHSGGLVQQVNKPSPVIAVSRQIDSPPLTWRPVR